MQNTFEGPPRPSLADGVSGTPAHAIDAPQDRPERLRRWIAALVTVLLHALLLVLVLQETEITLTEPQSQAGGSRMNVTLIDQTALPMPPEPVPPAHKPAPKKPKAPRAPKRPPSIPVAEATEPMTPTSADTTDTRPAPPTPASEPPEAAPDTPHEHPRELGQPPGLRPDDAAAANAALAAKLGSGRGRSTVAPPVGPSMGVDGFHVYYELVNETRLREWRKQGMTELFLPLPGTRRLMVCPLEVALRQGSSACRMVEQDSPELKSIGDARDVINIQRVYQLGEVVWSGPGPYR